MNCFFKLVAELSMAITEVNSDKSRMNVLWVFKLLSSFHYNVWPSCMPTMHFSASCIYQEQFCIIYIPKQAMISTSESSGASPSSGIKCRVILSAGNPWRSTSTFSPLTGYITWKVKGEVACYLFRMYVFNYYMGHWGPVSVIWWTCVFTHSKVQPWVTDNSFTS